MIFHSVINVRRNTIVDLIIRNIGYGYPYNFEKVIGKHGFSMPDILSDVNINPLADILNIYYAAYNPVYKDSILFAAGTNFAKIIVNEMPSSNAVAYNDVFWDFVNTIVEQGEYAPYAEVQMSELLKGIIDHYQDDDSIFNSTTGRLYAVSTDTYIRFPNIDFSTPKGLMDTIPIEIWVRMNNSMV